MKNLLSAENILSLLGYEKNTSFVRFLFEPLISIFGIEDNSESFVTGKIMSRLLADEETKKSLFDAIEEIKRTGEGIEIDGTGIKISRIGSNKIHNNSVSYIQ